MKRIDRIKKYEEIFDRVNNKLNAEFLNDDELQKDIEKLKRYYLGKNWLNDFKADEKGLLPKNLKRGVLSEDGVYNLLSRYDEMKEKLWNFIM